MIFENAHITAGEELNKILGNEEDLWVPFNEAMITGTYSAPLFTDAFIEERSQVHGVSKEMYTQKLQGFLNLLSHPNQYKRITLWFWDEPFCKANYVTVIKALQSYGFTGQIALHICNEENGDVLKRITVQ